MTSDRARQVDIMADWIGRHLERMRWLSEQQEIRKYQRWLKRQQKKQQEPAQ